MIELGGVNFEQAKKILENKKISYSVEFKDEFLRLKYHQPYPIFNKLSDNEEEEKFILLYDYDLNGNYISKFGFVPW